MPARFIQTTEIAEITEFVEEYAVTFVPASFVPALRMIAVSRLLDQSLSNLCDLRVLCGQQRGSRVRREHVPISDTVAVRLQVRIKWRRDGSHEHASERE